MNLSLENPMAVHFPSSTLCLTSKATSSSLSLAQVASYSQVEPEQPGGKVYALAQALSEAEVPPEGAPAKHQNTTYNFFYLTLSSIKFDLIQFISLYKM